MDELFRASDVLSLHCPLTDRTRGIVNAATIALMKDGAFLLNLARGPLLDEAAVAEALASGKLAGLGADVVSVEPITADNPLLSSPNTLLTPHIAWATLTARQNITRIIAENIAGGWRPAQKRGEQGLSERINDRGAGAPFSPTPELIPTVREERQ